MLWQRAVNLMCRKRPVDSSAEWPIEFCEVQVWSCEPHMFCQAETHHKAVWIWICDPETAPTDCQRKFLHEFAATSRFRCVFVGALSLILTCCFVAFACSDRYRLGMRDWRLPCSQLFVSSVTTTIGTSVLGAKQTGQICNTTPLSNHIGHVHMFWQHHISD